MPAKKKLVQRGVGRDVLSVARERTAYIFDRFDHVAVSFSGGKDSTIILQLALEAAHERGRLPLDVIFYDEEAIADETADYVQRVSERADVALRWYCIPLTHRNGCSRKEPFWYPWAPEARSRWVRPLPAQALTTMPGFHRQKMPEANKLLFPCDGKRYAMLLGLRADESLMRRRAVWNDRIDNYISPVSDAPWVSLCKPIYDWRTIDVWRAPHIQGWDYNQAYDLMARSGISPFIQRVAPPFGEEPMQSLWMWQVCWPDLWDKMVERVHGARTAARYSRTILYGNKTGAVKFAPPPGMSWKEAVAFYLERHTPEVRAFMAKRFKQDIRSHIERTNGRTIPEYKPDPDSGLCWANMLTLAMRGDVKGRGTAQARLRMMSRKDGANADAEAGTRY